MALDNDRMSTVSEKAPKRRGAAAKILPLCGLALLAILPFRLADLVSRLGVVWPHHAASISAPLPPVAGLTPADDNGPQPEMQMANGDTAREIISSTLAGGVRAPAPVGEDRPADGRLLAEVARRQAELDQKQHALDTKAAQVEAAENLAKQQIAELTKLRTQIEGLVVHETGAADADIDLLVGLYSNMKPTQAAAVIGKMEPVRAGLILQKLGDRAGGPILAAMDPTAALAISEEIAQRRAAFRN